VFNKHSCALHALRHLRHEKECVTTSKVAVFLCLIKDFNQESQLIGSSCALPADPAACFVI